MTWKLDHIKSHLGVHFNEPAKYKRWRGLLHRMIAKQQGKRELTHPVCLHAAEKYKKLESVNKENDYKTMSKKWTGKKKTDLFCVL